MGLDMYLSRVHREAIPYINHDPDEVKKNNPAIYQKMKPYLVKRGTVGVYQWDSLFEDMGYWRKANQIHNWFVENVQNGEDDCGAYEVSADQLTELRNLCVAVLTQSVMVQGKVKVGYTFDDAGNQVANTTDGKIIINPEIAEELLPTQGGFFFGGTDYDEYYLEDITDTVKILNTALAWTDFSTHAIFYSSSW